MVFCCPVCVDTEPDVVFSCPVCVDTEPDVVFSCPVCVDTEPDAVFCCPVCVDTEPDAVFCCPVCVDAESDAVFQVPEYQYPEDSTPEYTSILVPNVDNIRTDYLIETIAKQGKAVLLIGEQVT